MKIVDRLTQHVDPLGAQRLVEGLIRLICHSEVCRGIYDRFIKGQYPFGSLRKVRREKGGVTIQADTEERLLSSYLFDELLLIHISVSVFYSSKGTDFCPITFPHFLPLTGCAIVTEDL